MIFILVLLLSLVYIYLTWNFDYWTKRGVLSLKARVLLGDLPNGLLKTENVIYDIGKIYNNFKSKTPFVGMIQTRVPRLLILEPEVIKDVLIRKFNCFRYAELVEIVDTKLDPLFAKNPFMLMDEEWKEKRADITPAFTSNRLKVLYPIIQDLSAHMIKYIINESIKNEPLDSLEVAAKFTTDVVSNCIFGIDAESFTKEKPEIREMGKRILEPNFSNVVKLFLAESFPFMRKLMRIQFMPNDVKDFFVNLMQQALKHRAEKKICREDFLDHIIQLRNKKNISELEMASHTMSFFSDGFETSSVAISHALYEIGNNTRVQDKLRDEINKNCNKSGLISYETLTELPYLDQVFHESLRLHPPAVMISKQCTEKTDLEFDGKRVTVEKGINVFIPILQVHCDSDYYFEPDKFYPERFDDGAMKDYLDRCVFMPFGAGPRICLGMGFALMQTKAAIAAIVQNFEISVNKKTQNNPLVIDPVAFINVKVGGLWLDFKSLKKE
ncbi:hypothetical protein ACKWTF_009019 [Chironomus riparius]